MNDNSTADCPILLIFGMMVYYENDRRDVGRPPVTATFSSYYYHLRASYVVRSRRSIHERSCDSSPTYDRS